VRRLPALLLLLAVAVVAAATEPTLAARDQPSLQLALRRALTSRYLDPRRTSVLAVDLRTDRTVFERHASIALAPASSEKLTVAFAALRLLGPAYRFRTQVLGAGELVGHVWHGDLYLVGGGDPTIEKSDLATLAHDIRSWGIRRVAGSIVADERCYDARRGAPGWKSYFAGIESAPLSGLVVQGVRVRGLDGSAAVAAATFRQVLDRHGIVVAHHSRTGRAPRDVLPLALDYSEPLATIVQEMNRESDNFVAEMLLKQLGAALGGRGSTAVGAAVVSDELATAGISTDGVRIVDGSGLSRLDRLSAGTLVALLLAADRDPSIREPFLASLSVAGISGTLRDRLRKRPARGQVIAKTGTTSQASALAGFVRRRYVFAILQNGSPVDYWSARNAQDRFVRVLARS
jgi:D-alanyl-D-alanine carboxypeptidase/D-alanyl-D-alanine-endopeptidase (penicillin-binding protein 4)